jgi:deoxycytidine triphosphate deaminase
MAYLTRSELLRVLPELEIITAREEHPFSEAQVKVCSIDVRCDQIFWKQRRFSGALDLGSTVLMETSPRRHWRKIELALNRSIKLRPGEMILGRTYERFRVPLEYAGKITGRSSYARLGIEISCTCDLINPGWEGHVPLEIINNGACPVLIYPLLPLAQVFLLPLTSPVEHGYADRTQFKSKYMADDGGPSYWWRDDLVERIYQSYLSDRIDQEAVNRLKSQLDKLDDFGIFRFERFVRNSQIGEITNVEELIDRFVGTEKRAKRRSQSIRWVSKSFATVFLPVSLGSIYFSGTLSPIHWIVFGITLLLGVLGVITWVKTGGEEPKFLTSTL